MSNLGLMIYKYLFVVGLETV
uniref:Uncharacterized protein n=1 Tax=Arundo donax TaxID=35708 RepID=A0A0A9HII4_ARUDO